MRSRAAEIVCERGQRVKLGDTPNVTGTLEVAEVDLAVWNSYRIVAQGYVLRHFVNGRLAAEVQDMQPEKRSAKGVIALQMHAGPAMKVEFKDLRIQCGQKSESGGIAGRRLDLEKRDAGGEGKSLLPPRVPASSEHRQCLRHDHLR